MTAVLPAAAVVREVRCAHCGLDGALGDRDSVAERQFCCPGCRTAWDVIRAVGLGAYYDAEDRRAMPVLPSGRQYREFDHPTFERLYVRDAGEGLREVELYLEQVHCAS